MMCLPSIRSKGTGKLSTLSITSHESTDSGVCGCKTIRDDRVSLLTLTTRCLIDLYYIHYLCRTRSYLLDDAATTGLLCGPTHWNEADSAE